MTAPPSQRARRLLAGPLIAVASVGLAACGSGDQTIDDPQLPYSFTYPGGFQTGGQASTSSREEGFDNQTIVAKENGQDLVAVQTQRLRRSVTPKLVPRVKREVEQAARRTAKVRSRQDVRVAGLDGVGFQMKLRGSGVPVAARWIYAAHDRTLYWINCQWQADRQAVLDACNEVLRTFKTKK